MVTFNELRISDDRSCLIIDFEVERVDVFKNMYVEAVYLDYYKNANPASGVPGEKAVVVWENTNDDTTVKAKRIYYRLKDSDAATMGVHSFDNGLFYVIVKCAGEPTYQITNMPCGSDNPYRIGAILDWKAFYDRGMNYVNALFNGCNPCPDLTGFEHFAVLWNALKMALATCDWNLVSDLWDKFLLAPADVSINGSISLVSSGCGCR
jgi:hypothetical protein